MGGYLVAGGRGGGRRERGVEPRLGDADPPVEVLGGSDRVLDEIVPAKEVAELVSLGDGEASDGGAEAAEGEEVREGEAAQGDEGPRLKVLVDLLSGRRAVRSCQGNAAPFACTEGGGGLGSVHHQSVAAAAPGGGAGCRRHLEKLLVGHD